MAQWLKPGVVIQEWDVDNAIVPILIAEVATVNNREATIYNDPIAAYAALERGNSVAVRIVSLDPNQMQEVRQKYEDIAVKNNFAHAMKIYFRHVPVAQQEFYFARTDVSRPDIPRDHHYHDITMAFERDAMGNYLARTDALYKRVGSRTVKELLRTSDELLKDNDICHVAMLDEHTKRKELATIRIDCLGGVMVKFQGDAWTPVRLQPGAMTVRNVFESATPVLREILSDRHEVKKPAPVCPTVTSVQEAELLLRKGCGVAIDLNGKTQAEIDTITTRMRELMTNMPIPQVTPAPEPEGEYWNPVLVGEFQVNGCAVSDDPIRIVDAHTEASKSLKLGTSIALRMGGLARRCWGSVMEDFKVAAARHPHMTFRTYFRNVDDGQTQLEATHKTKYLRGHNPFCAILDDFAFVKQEDAAAAFDIKTDSADAYSTPAPTPAKPSLLDIDGHDIRLIGLTFRDTLRACQEDGEDKANTLLRIKAVIAPLVPTGYEVTVATFQTRSYHRSPGEFVGLKDHVVNPIWVLGMDLTRDDDPDILSFGEEIKPWW